MKNVNAPSICVTGATGFIGAHIVHDLLEDGQSVRGTVRSLADPKRVEHLMTMRGATTSLQLVEAELLHEGSYLQALEGCETVIHTASPYTSDVKDPQNDLVRPAVEGTLQVMRACAELGVRRVVLTSSMAAMTDEPDSEHVLTEADWNERSSLRRNPYYYSKTQAERAAWDFVQEQNPSFSLVAINPFFVIGPSLSPGLNISNKIFVDILDGVYPGIVNVTWAMVDVRDVAAAHIRAAQDHEASGRYICAATSVSMRRVVEILQEHGFDERFKLPKLNLECSLGDYTVKLASYFQPKGTGSYLRTHIGRVPRFDNSKIQRELGITFRQPEETIPETVEDLLRWRYLRT